MRHKKIMLAAILASTLSFQVSHVHPRSFFGAITKPFRMASRSARALKNKASGNLHQVHPGLYRSAQQSQKKLDRTIKKYEIKTIINLRGENDGKKWYEAEKRVAKEHGVKLVNISTNSKRRLPKKSLKQILTACEEGRKKGDVLIHCEGGSDRTGAVAAILQYNRTHNRHQARRQLSLKYGHIKSRKPNMGRSVDRWIWCMRKAKNNQEKALALY